MNATSSTNNSTIGLKILGKDYRVACTPENRESLGTAAALLNSKLTEITDRSKGTSERLAVMAALDLAHELVSAGSAPASSLAALEVETLQRRIDSIEARVALATDVD